MGLIVGDGPATSIRERTGDLGFTMAMSGWRRIYDTFDAHRLLQSLFYRRSGSFRT
jgi:hypothetical protein